MRIVVWNCRMAFLKKRDLLLQLRADIAVIPECSQDSMVACTQDGFDTCWWGNKKHKGLGVMAAKPWTLEADGQSRSRPRQKWIAPVRVRGPREFRLLCVWACPVGNVREKNYVGQTYEAIVRHPQWFEAGVPTVICGDFNSNSIWDPGRKTRTHSAVVQLLADRGLVSAYHSFFSESHGSETRPTYYFWHRQERPFHLDYVFVPSCWRVTDLQVGSYAQWCPVSDHVPIVVDIDDRM